MSIPKIDCKEFIRRFAIRPNGAYSFLLGAGASASAGLPTAQMVTWALKRTLFCSLHQIHEDSFKDLELEHNKKILQDFFDSQKNYPPLYSYEEYSFYFEKCYPSSDDRRLFIQGCVRDINPALGHLCLGALMLSTKVDVVWTTNFDQLVESAIHTLEPAKGILVVSPENSASLNRIHENFPKVLKFHGDYRYDVLQNTVKETQQLNDALSLKFIEESVNKGLIIIGY